MGAAKTIGGLLVFIAGVLVLLVALQFLGILTIFPSSLLYAYVLLFAGDAYQYVGLLLAIVVIVSGIIGMAGKKAGGVIALLIGVLWLMGGFLLSSVPLIFPMSAIYFWTDQIVIPNGIIAIEAIICFLGGLLIVASGED